jgi:hypothetical protein
MAFLPVTAWIRPEGALRLKKYPEIRIVACRGEQRGSRDACPAPRNPFCIAEPFPLRSLLTGELAVSAPV